MNYLDSSMEEWKKAFLSLREDTFFYIVKNYLGALSTPYNKQTLFNELLAYFTRPRTTERVISLLDNTDRALITAVYLLPYPSLTNLYSLFRDDFTYLELHNRLRNLEERLLLYRKPVSSEANPKDAAQISITPLFSPSLKKRGISTEALFPSVPLPFSNRELQSKRDVTTQGFGGLWLRDGLLPGLLSYIVCHPDCIKSDGRIKKKNSTPMERLFPAFFRNSNGMTRLKKTLHALEKLHLLSFRTDALRPIIPSWFSLGELKKEDRQYYLFAAYYGPEESELQLYTGALSFFFSNLQHHRAYPLSSIAKLLILSLIIYGLPPVNQEGLISSLLELNALEEVDQGLYRKNPILDPSLEETPLEETPRTSKNLLTLESNFEITLSRRTDFSTHIEIALFAEIQTNELSPRYELHKSSLWHYFTLDKSDRDLLAFLKTHSTTPTPQNVAFSVQQWYREFTGAGLYRGVVLTLDKERVHLIEHSTNFNKWIKKRLALGIYLLDPSQEKEWLPALKRAGLDPPPSVIQVGQDSDYETDYPIPEERPSLPGTTNPSAKDDGPDPQQKLLEELSKLNLSKDREEEWKAKIRKKLILFPEQLSLDAPGGLVSEAKGIDFLGKVRVIEQALGDESTLLEIVERNKQGEPHRILLVPLALEHGENSKELMLRGKSLPGEGELHFKVSKLSLVRQVKSSLFSP